MILFAAGFSENFLALNGDFLKSFKAIRNKAGADDIDAAGLGFLGLGAQPPTPEWGLLLSRNKSHIFTSPWMVIFPGVAIMFLVLGFNLLGDGLRDALDPWLR